MKNKVILEANIGAKISGIYKILMICGILAIVGYLYGFLSGRHHNHHELLYWVFLLAPPILCITLLIILSIITQKAKSNADMFHLRLLSDGLSYGYFYSQEIWEIISIDTIISAVIKHSFYDRFTGGKTIIIHTTKGIIKFHWIHNAEEFIEKTKEHIQISKAKKTENKPQESPKPTSTVETKPIEVKKSAPTVEKNTVQQQSNSVKDEQTMVFCHKCGTKATGESAFCHKCGTKLNWSDKK